MDKKAQAQALILPLIMAVGVGVLLLILLTSLGGVVYDNVDDDLNSIGANLVTDELHNITANNTEFALLNGFVLEDTITAYDFTNSTDVTITESYVFRDDKYLTLVNESLKNADVKFNYTYGLKDVRDRALDTLTYGFDANKLTAQYIPLLVLALIIVVVVGAVIGMSYMGRGGMGGGAL